MSSVGSSDSSNSSNSTSNANDQIRKNRENSASNESELVKKQAKEIRRLNEEHYNEVEGLKKAHADQMDDLRKNTNREISERDHKYNQDTEQLRDLYKKQMQTQADEGQKRDEALRKATSGDLTQEKVQADQRFQKLTSDYEIGLQEREHRYEEALKENRETQANAISDTRDKLQRNYDVEAKSIKDERNERVGGLQKGYDDYRQSTEAAQRDADLRHFQDQQRSSENLLRAVRKERLVKEDSETYLREGFKDALGKTRDRYEKAQAKERAAIEMSRDDMKSTVGERIDNEVTRLKRENLDLKDNNTRQDLINKQKLEHQVGDISDSYQKTMENMQQQRDEAVRATNDRVHRDVQKVRKELDTQATATNRYYRQQQEEQNMIQRTAYDNLKGDLELRVDQTNDRANKRVKNLYETTSEEKSRMAELQADNHKASQNAHQDEMNTLRTNLASDKQIAVNTLQERLQKQEMQHSERMALVVAKYEKQIQGLKDQLVREKKQNDDNLKRTTEEMQRQHKVEMDQVASQNRDHLRQLDAHHGDELRSLNKRNDERLDQVLAEVKKT
jgi:hypothetical protein